MALIKCTECGKDFSDKASSCPHCGCPNEPQKAETIVVEKKAEEKKAKSPLSTLRLALSILLLVVSPIIAFQSFVMGTSNVLEGSDGSDGAYGFMVTVCFLLFGIMGIVKRNTDKCASLYVMGIIMGVVGLCAWQVYSGAFADLHLWGALLSICGLVHVISGGLLKEKAKK